MAAVALAGLVALAVMPWGLLARHAAGPLGRALGRPVTIGGAHRVDHVSFVPIVALTDVVLGQPAGFAGAPMVRIARVEVHFPALPLLLGRFHPRAIRASGAEILLLRDAAGRANWEAGSGDKDGNGDLPSLDTLSIRQSRLRLIDAKRHITLAGPLAADGATGIAFDGAGSHRGTPLTLRLRVTGPPAAPLRRVALAVRSSLARLDGTARLAAPLDTRHFTADLTASGTDLRYLDDIIQAGLFPTRPFTLGGQVTHDGDAWHLPALTGTIGRSRLTARIDVAKQAGRTRLTGKVDATTLDFDDFSSAQDRAQAAVRERRAGPRVIPATRIRLDKLGRLDGVIDLDARRLLSAKESPFRSLKVHLALDRRRLEARPLVAGLRSGTIGGGAVVDHRGASPRLSLDVRLAGARIERLLLPGDAIEGPIAARLRLRGSGDTMRAALAGGSGDIGLVMRGGSMRRDYAIFAGGDVLKTVGTLIGGNEGRRTPVRCLIGDFRVANGIVTPRRLTLDTPITRADGSGRIVLADERVALSLAGRGRDVGPLVSTAPVLVMGTLSAPRLDIRPPRAEAKGKSGVLDRIGFFLKGLKTKREAQPAGAPAAVDCRAGAAAALG